MKPLYFDSSNFLRIQKILTDLLNEPSTEFIIAPTRTGKTVGSKHFELNNKKVFYIDVKPGETGNTFWSKFLSTLSKRHGLNTNHERGNTNYLIENSSHILTELKHYNLIIIDEVGNFKAQFIKLVRQLLDNAYNKCSVVLTAPEYALKRMYMWESKGVDGIAEFLSRIEYVHELPTHTPHDIKSLLKKYEINPVLNKHRSKNCVIRYSINADLGLTLKKNPLL